MESVAIRGDFNTRISRSTDSVRIFVRRSPFAAIWGVVGLLLILMAVGAPVISPAEPNKTNFTKMSEPPDAANYFGTDQIGRDLLSRIFHGAQVSLFVAFASVLLGTTIGGVWGLVSGYLGGLTDMISQRFVEIIMALPGLILAFALVLVLGAGRLDDHHRNRGYPRAFRCEDHTLGRAVREADCLCGGCTGHRRVPGSHHGKAHRAAVFCAIPDPLHRSSWHGYCHRGLPELPRDWA